MEHRRSELVSVAGWTARTRARPPIPIVVCSDIERHKLKGFWIQDCAAVTQNILLLLHGSGLGATWTGIYPEQDRLDGVKKILHIPDSTIPVSLVLLGYPKRKGTEKEHDLETRIHYNRLPVDPNARYSYGSVPPLRPSQK